MTYSQEQIDKYLSLLKPREKVKSEKPPKVSCRICKSEKFFVESGLNICEECGMSQGHVLGIYDKRNYQRVHFRQKSIYQRKYHYEKKINSIYKKIQDRFIAR